VAAAARWACTRIALPDADVIIADVEALGAYLPRGPA